jgi:hypothetical protein
MNPDDIFNRLLYVMTALAVGAAFVSSESFTSPVGGVWQRDLRGGVLRRRNPVAIAPSREEVR